MKVVPIDYKKAIESGQVLSEGLPNEPERLANGPERLANGPDLANGAAAEVASHG